MNARTSAWGCRSAIDKAGGLCTAQDLAARWGISPQRMSQIIRYPDFPAPVYSGSRIAVFLVCEADAWRAIERKPGPKTNRKD